MMFTDADPSDLLLTFVIIFNFKVKEINCEHAKKLNHHFNGTKTRTDDDFLKSYIKNSIRYFKVKITTSAL